MEKTAIMEKLYYEDPYQKTFTAQVLSCEPGKKCRYQVILDQTAFYPEGGGQPCEKSRAGGALTNRRRA